MPSLPHKKTEQKAKYSSIKKYKGLSKDKLLNIPNEVGQVKNRKIYENKAMPKDY